MSAFYSALANTLYLAVSDVLKQFSSFARETTDAFSVEIVGGGYRLYPACHRIQNNQASSRLQYNTRNTAKRIAILLTSHSCV
jgi:hypothetical protein